jgi:hypothetical protein
MRFLVLLWAAVEVLQIVLIAGLAIGYRNLRRRLDAPRDFATNPPPSVTEE